ncbi:MAG: glycosyltransferase family 4 protein [Chloroflexi bacterium]|nr:glycosyltransferase family 4 protein [Chloroflexota bacterium]
MVSGIRPTAERRAGPDERLVYLEPAWKRHSSYRLLVERPPPGYRFVPAGGAREAVIRRASRFPAVYSALYALDRLLPAHLLKSCWDIACRPPAETRLTYAVNHLVLRREPWLLDLPAEHVSNTIGGYRHFRRFRGLVRRALGSPRCRAIVVNTEAGRKALAAAMGDDATAKTSVVPWAVEPKPFAKEYGVGDSVKLLFVDSANIPGQFLYKGGPETLEAFVALRQRHPGLEMVVRSEVPRALRQRYAGTPGLRLIDDVVPWPELEREFMTTDVFVLPTRFTLLTVLLDAMSYELPVVTTDVWGNPEIVEHGVNGLLVHDERVAGNSAEMLPRYFIPPPGSKLHRRLFGTLDRGLVAGLVEALARLIEDIELRRRLGRAGRLAVERGRFSIPSRNEVLGRVLDAAIGEDGDGS